MSAKRLSGVPDCSLLDQPAIRPAIQNPVYFPTQSMAVRRTIKKSDYTTGTMSHTLSANDLSVTP